MLAIGDASDYFAIPFCVLNSLQGFFILVLHIVRIANVRKAWLWACGWPKQEQNTEYEIRAVMWLIISNQIEYFEQLTEMQHRLNLNQALHVTLYKSFEC